VLRFGAFDHMDRGAGDMKREAVLRSVGLFAREVMPAFGGGAR